MKRLVKSELKQMFKIFNDKLPLYKNPTDDEIFDVFLNSVYIRGIIYDNGDWYIWSGDVFHNYIKSAIPDLDIENGFRFAYYGDSWLINAHDKFSLKQTIEQIKKYKNKLNLIGSLENQFMIENCTDIKLKQLFGDEIFN